MNIRRDILVGTIVITASGGELLGLARSQSQRRHSDGEPARCEADVGDLQSDGVAGHVLELGRDDGIPFTHGGGFTLQINGGDSDDGAVPIHLIGHIL
ncbi:hypothetical protein D3C84_1041120 [compost metagenome]